MTSLKRLLQVVGLLLVAVAAIGCGVNDSPPTTDTPVTPSGSATSDDFADALFASGFKKKNWLGREKRLDVTSVTDETVRAGARVTVVARYVARWQLGDCTVTIVQDVEQIASWRVDKVLRGEKQLPVKLTMLNGSPDADKVRRTLAEQEFLC